MAKPTKPNVSKEELKGYDKPNAARDNTCPYCKCFFSDDVFPWHLDHCPAKP